MSDETAVVLNVNDNAATRYMMTRILKRGGFQVLEAETGAEALDSVARERPDLVLLDVRLPDISGLEVCRRIKSDPALAHTLIVQTSATFASSDRRVEGLDSGADAYLAQPVEALELLATLRAILRTRRAEEREHHTARKLQRTFDAIQDALFLLAPDGVIDGCNHAAAGLLGSSVPELTGQNAYDALRDLVKPAALSDLVRVARHNRREAEMSIAERWFRVSADPINGDGNGLRGSVVILSEITEQKRLEEELRRRLAELAEASRRKDEFLGMLAHELRNPLNAISAANTVLSRTDSGADPNHGRLLNIISRNTTTLARLIDDLLEVSRITRGQLQLRKRTVDLTEIVRQAAEGCQTVLDGRKQQLQLNLPGRPVLVEGDDLRLEQVILNLLTNAAKYSEPGDVIELSLGVRADGDPRLAELRVRDQGLGIPSEMLGPIFEPFVQVDQSLSRSLGGIGIGLTMVRGLVELHGGHVRATSEGLGKGAEFVVELPLATPSTDTPSRESDAPKATVEAPAVYSVLVVEDNPDTLDLIQALLEMLGHSVQGASDGKSGLELALSMRPQIALVDIGLPVLSGYEVAKNLRATAAGRDTYLVAVTGYGRPEDRARALDAGFDAYLVKPIDGAALAKVLRPRRERAEDAVSSIPILSSRSADQP